MSFRQLFLLIIYAFFAANVCNAQITKRESAAPLPRFEGEIDVIDSACANAGITLSSLKPPAVIEKVRLGSPALYANLAPEMKFSH